MIATWNVGGLCGKEKELIEELSERNIDIAVISETKK
jgi:exonuclease III